jgi:hypothetical protein
VHLRTRKFRGDSRPGSLSEKNRVDIAIDYIAPVHLEKSPNIFESVKDELDGILSVNPKAALGKLSDIWPFEIDASCTLSGVAMSTKISFPRNSTKPK